MNAWLGRKCPLGFEPDQNVFHRLGVFPLPQARAGRFAQAALPRFVTVSVSPLPTIFRYRLRRFFEFSVPNGFHVATSYFIVATFVFCVNLREDERCGCGTRHRGRGYNESRIPGSVRLQLWSPATCRESDARP